VLNRCKCVRRVCLKKCKSATIYNNARGLSKSQPIHTHTHTYTHEHKHTHTHTQTLKIYKHTYIHTCVCLCLCVCAQVCVFFFSSTFLFLCYFIIFFFGQFAALSTVGKTALPTLPSAVRDSSLNYQSSCVGGGSGSNAAFGGYGRLKIGDKHLQAKCDENSISFLFFCRK